jgi:serine/threonine protein kinase
VLATVRHPFIVNLWGTFQDVNNLFMVMDFVPGGELFTLLRKSKVRGILWCFTQVADGFGVAAIPESCSQILYG